MLRALAVGYALLMAAAAEGAGPELLVQRGVAYGKGGPETMRMDVCRLREAAAARPRPVIVFIHGGGWRWGNRDSHIVDMARYAEAGYFAVSISHRFAPAHVFPAQIHDVKCAIRYLRAHAAEHRIDPDRIGVIGYSSGGHLAALLGTSAGVAELEGDGGWADQSSRVQAVCSYFGSHDFVMMEKDEKYGIGRGIKPDDNITVLMGGPLKENMEKARLATPATFISRDDPPFLLIHGTADPLVPYPLSPLLLENLKKGGVEAELIPVEGAKHGGREFSTDDIRRKEESFFAKHLK